MLCDECTPAVHLHSRESSFYLHFSCDTLLKIAPKMLKCSIYSCLDLAWVHTAFDQWAQFPLPLKQTCVSRNISSYFSCWGIAKAFTQKGQLKKKDKIQHKQSDTTTKLLLGRKAILLLNCCINVIGAVPPLICCGFDQKQHQTRIPLMRKYQRYHPFLCFPAAFTPWLLYTSTTSWPAWVRLPPSACLGWPECPGTAFCWACRWQRCRGRWGRGLARFHPTAPARPGIKRVNGVQLLVVKCPAWKSLTLSIAMTPPFLNRRRDFS